MPPLLSGQWHSLLAKHAKIWRRAAQKATEAIESRLTDAARGPPKLQPIPVRNTTRPQLGHLPRAQQSSRWISTRAWKAAARHYSSIVGKTKDVYPDRAAYRSTTIARHISRSSGRAPFASTLRPNLTGGTLGRSAGGYTLGSGRVGAARYFSHGPANPAHVVQNVSQGVRAFALSGSKARYNGTDPATGNKRYTAVTPLQHHTFSKLRGVEACNSPGTRIEFRVSPTITALNSLGQVPSYETTSSHLNTDGLLDFLSNDFARALKDLPIILSDLNRLASLGDLQMTCHKDTLRVHFPGVDEQTVQALCSDIGLQRGIVVQDADFGVAFQTAELPQSYLQGHITPAELDSESRNGIDWRTMLTPLAASRDGHYAFSTSSVSGLEDIDHSQAAEQTRDATSCDADDWASQDSFDSDYGAQQEDDRRRTSPHDPLDYQGLAGVFRFIQQCDAAVPSSRPEAGAH